MCFFSKGCDPDGSRLSFLEGTGNSVKEVGGHYHTPEEYRDSLRDFDTTYGWMEYEGRLLFEKSA